MLVSSKKAVRKSLHTKEQLGVGTASRTDFSQNSRPYIVFKLRDLHGHASSPRQCLLFIGHGWHPCIACSPLVMAYTHTFFYALCITPTHFCFSASHFVDFIYICCIHHRLMQYITHELSFWLRLMVTNQCLAYWWIFWLKQASPCTSDILPFFCKFHMGCTF